MKNPNHPFHSYTYYKYESNSFCLLRFHARTRTQTSAPILLDFGIDINGTLEIEKPTFKKHILKIVENGT